MKEIIKTKNRDSNIELLRIILMIVIVLHHYIVNSGITQVITDSISADIIGGGVQLYSPFAWMGR